MYGAFPSQTKHVTFELFHVRNARTGNKSPELRVAQLFFMRLLFHLLQAVIFLHENCTVHRDINARNILLTKEGEVKLVDFGLSWSLSGPLDGTDGCLGSPCWMAPEVITSRRTRQNYGNRADVWALGVTTIELGDGRAPYESMHPTRALFQIVTNPPPTLCRPFNWSENYVDFINE
jgi:myosin-3